MAYTASQAQKAKGTVLNVNTGSVSVPTWTPAYERTSIKPSMKNESDEATNFDSAATEHILTMPDGGEWSVAGNRVTSDLGGQTIENAFFSQALLQFQVIAPKATGQSTNGDKWAYYAYVNDFNPDFDPKKKIMDSAKLRTTNGVTFTRGA